QEVHAAGDAAAAWRRARPAALRVRPRRLRPGRRAGAHLREPGRCTLVRQPRAGAAPGAAAGARARGGAGGGAAGHADADHLRAGCRDVAQAFGGLGFTSTMRALSSSIALRTSGSAVGSGRGAVATAGDGSAGAGCVWPGAGIGSGAGAAGAGRAAPAPTCRHGGIGIPDGPAGALAPVGIIAGGSTGLTSIVP